MAKKMVVGLLVCAICFSLGFAFHKWKLFPYPELRDFYLAFPDKVKWRTDFYEDTTGRKRVDCPQDKPLVFLAMGQAGSANYISSYGHRDEGRRAYQFFDGQCYLIEDPMLGATGIKGSLWSDLAQDISASTGRDVVFITAGVGGSSLADWIRDDSVYFERAEHQIRLAKNLGYEVKLVFWYNGAREADLKTTADEYVERFNRLLERFDSLLADAGASQWIIFQTSKCWSEGDPEVLRGQQRAADGNERVILGPDTDAYDDRYRYDGCHLNHNAKVLINTELKKILKSVLSAH